MIRRAAPLIAGALTALLAILLVSSLPGRWTVATLGALALLIPLPFLKNPRLYGVGLFLLLLVFEADKGFHLTRNFMDHETIIETLGIPPMRTMGVILRPSDVVLLVLLFSWVVRIVLGRTSPRLPGIALLPFAYVVWAGVTSFLGAPHLSLSLVELLQQAKYFLLFVYVLNNVDTRELAEGVVRVLTLCLFLEGVLTIAGLRIPLARDLLTIISARGGPESLYPAYETGAGERAVGTFRDYAVTASYLIFVFPLALRGALLRKGGRRWAYLALFAVALAALWLTYSRAGLAGAFAAIACWLYLVLRGGYVSPRNKLAIVYASVVLLAIASPFVVQYMVSRPAFTRARLPLLRSGLLMVVDNPVAGVGLNNSTAVKKELFVSPTGTEDWGQPIHNYYLIVASETGLVGFALFMSFFLLIARRAARLTRAGDEQIATLAMALLSTYAGYAVMLLAIQMASYVEFAMLCFYAGLVVAGKEMIEAPPVS